MCKLAYIRTKDGSAYKRVLHMIHFQENVVAGHSTGIVYRTLTNEFKHRKAVGKVNSFMVEYPDKPSSDEALGFSRYATVGAITAENTQPVSIMLGRRKIGFGLHNGTFSEYKSYENYRSPNMVNKTDSALLYTIYSRVLEELGDSKMNRMKAFSFVRNLIKNGSNHNLIMMFKDGMILFGGNALTFSKSPDVFGIMTFGLDNKVKDGYIYSYMNGEVGRYDIAVPRTSIRKRKPTEPEQLSFDDFGGFC